MPARPPPFRCENLSLHAIQLTTPVHHRDGSTPSREGKRRARADYLCIVRGYEDYLAREVAPKLHQKLMLDRGTEVGISKDRLMQNAIAFTEAVAEAPVAE